MTLNAPFATQDCDFRIEHLRLRAWARCRLHLAGDLTLHEAVDELQREAELSGLVDEIGQDSVQALLADQFAMVTHAEPI